MQILVWPDHFLSYELAGRCPAAKYPIGSSARRQRTDGKLDGLIVIGRIRREEFESAVDLR